MGKSLRSDYPQVSSAPPAQHQRAKSLGLSHAQNIPAPRHVSSPAKFQSGARKASRYDSSNFRAAQKLLQTRLDSGLTQEEVGAIVGEHWKQVGRRERGDVWLGPLRQLVLLERARDAKLKGTK